MIKKILIAKAKHANVDGRDLEISAEKMYFVEDITKDYHTSDGVLKKEDLQKKDVKISSNKGKEFIIIDANFVDSYKGIRKSAQTIPLKDLGYILSELCVEKSWTIVDAGAGSGGCACFLARYAKKVYTYDENDVNLKQTEENIKYFELKNVVVKKQDVYENIPNKNVDLIVLDLPEPWRAMQHAHKALRIGGFLVTYCPQITQSHTVVNTAAANSGFIQLKSVEISEREWKIDGRIVRPKSLSNIHSGFLSIFRKIE